MVWDTGQAFIRVLEKAYPELRGVPTTKELDQKKYVVDEINYYGQKRAFLWNGLREMLLGRPWVFNQRTALPL